MSYEIDDIKHLETREAMRTRINMYLGSADEDAIYQAIKEILNNATDEALAGYGNKITVSINEKENWIKIGDFGRGIPFGIKDGKNVLVSIFTESHTGGKFDKKAYKNSSGLNGIGATAACMAAKNFTVISRRDGKFATAVFEEGILKSYTENKQTGSNVSGTTIHFEPDYKVFKDTKETISYDRICNEIKAISYFNKGIDFYIYDVNDESRSVHYISKNGISDFIKDTVKKPLMKPIICEAADETDKVEIAFVWADEPTKSYTFVNSLCCPDGGTPVTGAKNAITRTIKKLTEKDFDSDILTRNLIYAINCTVLEPSFANQTKSKINNANLRTLAGQAFKEGLETFAKSKEFQSIIDMLGKAQKAEIAAEKARKAVLNGAKEIENAQKRKVFNSDKLKDAEFLGENSILLICEGDSANGSITKARDYTRYGALSLKGKMINGLAESDEERLYQNDEVKLLLKAMNIVPGKYDAKKLRYGKIAICTDADSDGSHIGLLIMANLYKFAPDFIREGRLYWLRTPLWVNTVNGKEYYYFTDEELAPVRSKLKGSLDRNKGLGSLDVETARRSMFTEEFQRMDRIKASEESLELLSQLMGADIEPRREYVFNNIDFSTIRE
jgi:DNA gyrase subunit B